MDEMIQNIAMKSFAHGKEAAAEESKVKEAAEAEARAVIEYQKRAASAALFQDLMAQGRREEAMRVYAQDFTTNRINK